MNLFIISVLQLLSERFGVRGRCHFFWKGWRRRPEFSSKAFQRDHFNHCESHMFLFSILLGKSFSASLKTWNSPGFTNCLINALTESGDGLKRYVSAAAADVTRHQKVCDFSRIAENIFIVSWLNLDDWCVNDRNVLHLFAGVWTLSQPDSVKSVFHSKCTKE